jgi:hypothetical protein
MQEIKFVGSFEEVLQESEPSDPRMAAIALLRLPVTRGLEPRYAFVISGVGSEQITRLLGGVIDQLAQKLAPG